MSDRANHAGLETNYARGVRAENAAALYLEQNGYEVLHRRYKTKYGEIDLIAVKNNLLCFVEVKCRPTQAEALESVHLKTRHRIENTALMFIAEQPGYNGYDMRFDVLALVPDARESFLITHLDNAWEACS